MITHNIKATKKYMKRVLCLKTKCNVISQEIQNPIKMRKQLIHSLKHVGNHLKYLRTRKKGKGTNEHKFIRF